MAFGAVIFDFNGTLSDDEPILYEVYAELFPELRLDAMRGCSPEPSPMATRRPPLPLGALDPRG